MAEKSKTKKRRNPVYYKLQFMQTERNQKRKLAKHVRSFPEDQNAIARLDEMVGKTAVAGHIANMSARARRRMNRVLTA